MNQMTFKTDNQKENPLLRLLVNVLKEATRV